MDISENSNLIIAPTVLVKSRELGDPKLILWLLETLKLP